MRPNGQRKGELRVRGYVDRAEFIVDRCRGRRVLDLGVVGETCLTADARVAGFPSSLHTRIRDVAASVVGVDHSQTEVAALLAADPSLRLYAADVEAMAEPLADEAPFQAVIAGDVIEHLSNPGLALEQAHRVLEPGGSLIVSSPNAYGAPNYARFLLGRYAEGADHVQSYTKYTLANLLERHDFEISGVWTGIDHWPRSAAKRSLYTVAMLALKALPALGGTLIVVARRH
jgi:SAM-dependent methyltransferase